MQTMPQNLVNSKQQTVNREQRRRVREDSGGATFRKRITSILPAMAIIVFVSFNCAPSKLIRNDLVWPQPPEKPRIKFVEILSNDKDLLTTSWDKFKDFLFGWLARNYLDNPYACAAYRTTRVYVSDPGSNAVFVFDRERKDVWLIGTEKEGGLWMPVGLDVDENGNLYVVDTKQAKVFVYDSNGKFLRSFGEGKLTNPVGLTFANHRVYVTDSKAHVIKVFDPAGNLEKEIGRRGSGDGEFNFPLYITHDKEGNIYVVDTMNFRFQIFDREGNFIKAIGSPGDVSGTFARPKGIAVDSEGHIYVSDAAFNNVQIFDKEGNFLLNFGSYGRAPGELLFPAGMCFDEIDRLYIAEQMNSRVQVFQYVKVQP